MSVVAVDDDVAESTPHQGMVTLTANGTFGGDYTTTFNVSAAITDNDVVGVRASVSFVSVLENSVEGFSYTLVLTSQPLSTVTVTPTPEDGDSLVVLTAPLVFSRATWRVPQRVLVMPVDNLNADAPVRNVTVRAHAKGQSLEAVCGGVTLLLCFGASCSGCPDLSWGLLGRDAWTSLFTPAAATVYAAVFRYVTSCPVPLRSTTPCLGLLWTSSPPPFKTTTRQACWCQVFRTP